ncbi:MAG: DUF4142 domain-containing protein [Phycisphaerae bacterium]
MNTDKHGLVARKLLGVGVLAVVMLGGWLGSGCYSTTPPLAVRPDPGEVALRENLPELAKGHSDKIELGWYAASLLRHLDPPVKEFAKKMEADHKRLQKRLQAWAKANKYDLKFHYGDDTPGKARAAMEKDDGDALQAMKNPDFERTMLMFMYSDYDWQKHLIQALLPVVKDAELKGYLEESLKVHQEHFASVNTLLERYQFK